MNTHEPLGINGKFDINAGLSSPLFDNDPLSISIDSNSALLGLKRQVKASRSLDSFASELDRLSPLETKAGSSVGNVFDNELLLNQRHSLAFPLFQPLNSNSINYNSTTGKDSLTGNTTNTPLVGIADNDLLTGASSLPPRLLTANSVTSQTGSPSFAIRSEGTLIINNGMAAISMA